jgi:hypothetical protein
MILLLISCDICIQIVISIKNKYIKQEVEQEKSPSSKNPAIEKTSVPNNKDTSDIDICNKKNTLLLATTIDKLFALTMRYKMDFINILKNNTEDLLKNIDYKGIKPDTDTIVGINMELTKIDKDRDENDIAKYIQKNEIRIIELIRIIEKILGKTG